MLERSGYERTVHRAKTDPVSGEVLGVRRLAQPPIYGPVEPLLKISSGLLAANSPNINPFSLYTLRCEPSVSNCDNDPLAHVNLHSENYSRVLSNELESHVQKVSRRNVMAAYLLNNTNASIMRFLNPFATC